MLPAEVSPGVNAEPSGRFSLEDAKLGASFAKVLTECLRVLFVWLQTK